MEGDGWIDGSMDRWMDDEATQRLEKNLIKGPDRESSRCLLLAPPVPTSTLLLCSRRLTALTTISGLPALWLPVGFGPWDALAGDRWGRREIPWVTSGWLVP